MLGPEPRARAQAACVAGRHQHACGCGLRAGDGLTPRPGLRAAEAAGPRSRRCRMRPLGACSPEPAGARLPMPTGRAPADLGCAPAPPPEGRAPAPPPGHGRGRAPECARAPPGGPSVRPAGCRAPSRELIARAVGLLPRRHRDRG
jgi:hypothetical protein